MKVIRATTAAHAKRVEVVLQRTQGTAALLVEPGNAWYIFSDGDTDIGIAHAHPISQARVYVNAVLLPEHAHSQHRKPAMRRVLNDLDKALPEALRYETTIPKKDSVKMRWFSQLGFKREGVAHRSIRVDGEVADQYYMALLK